MLALTLLATVLAGDDRLLIRVQEPTWSEADISINARLLMLVEIQPADAVADAWLEVRTERDEDWQAVPIPESRRVRISETRSVFGPTLEPRSLHGVRSGDTLRVRICADGWNGARGSSSTLKIRVREGEEREAALLAHLDGSHRVLQDLRTEFERDHRKLSRIERRLRDAEVPDAVASKQLDSLASAWTSRSEEVGRLSATLSDELDAGVTDRLVDRRREIRWRRKLVEALRAAADGPLSAMEEALARARRAKIADERRPALLEAVEASDRFLDIFEGPVAELEVWRSGLELRCSLRSMIREQKRITEELDRDRKR